MQLGKHPDAQAIELLNQNLLQPGDYGRIRSLASLAWALMAPVAGTVNGRWGVRAGIAAYTALALAALPAALRLPLKALKVRGRVTKGEELFHRCTCRLARQKGLALGGPMQPGMLAWQCRHALVVSPHFGCQGLPAMDEGLEAGAVAALPGAAAKPPAAEAGTAAGAPGPTKAEEVEAQRPSALASALAIVRYIEAITEAGLVAPAPGMYGFSEISGPFMERHLAPPELVRGGQVGRGGGPAARSVQPSHS